MHPTWSDSAGAKPLQGLIPPVSARVFLRLVRVAVSYRSIPDSLILLPSIRWFCGPVVCHCIYSPVRAVPLYGLHRNTAIGCTSI